MTAGTCDDGFLQELERTAKGLSVVTDRAAADHLRRLVSELRAEGGDGPGAGRIRQAPPLDDGGCAG